MGDCHARRRPGGREAQRLEAEQEIQYRSPKSQSEWYTIFGGVSNPLCDIPSGRCFFTGPWTVTRSSLRTLRRVAAFCRPLRPVLLLVSFPRSRSPVFGPLPACLPACYGDVWSAPPPPLTFATRQWFGRRVSRCYCPLFPTLHFPFSLSPGLHPGLPQKWCVTSTADWAITCAPHDHPMPVQDKAFRLTRGVAYIRGSVCPARARRAYFCIKYPIPSPRFLLTLGSRNMRIQQHKMSLPPLPTTKTLTIIINWGQRMGHILRHARRYSRLFGEGGQRQAGVGNGQKKMPGALILPLRPTPLRPTPRGRGRRSSSGVRAHGALVRAMTSFMAFPTEDGLTERPHCPEK